MEIKEKPPDPPENEQVYRMIKCPLKSVLKEYNKLQPIIDEVVKDINKFVILGYQFIRLYLLDKFNNNKEFPTINKNFILDVFNKDPPKDKYILEKVVELLEPIDKKYTNIINLLKIK